MQPAPSKARELNADGSEKLRYSDKELEEFRELIVEKIKNAKAEFQLLQQQLNNANDNGTDDTSGTFKMLEDGSETLAKEEAAQLAARQRKFIEQLENALIRIKNKTFGICRVTGKLIPKDRLRAVPHTTQSIEAKLLQNRD
ncbi:MAG: TraR/DksA C4-type zinc finger protein [Bacteroidia bacterium]|nr:TraR/DksA C4-type zinc finger protein [Bacteroidia bacterium]